MTNREKLNGMTNNELANWLAQPITETKSVEPTTDWTLFPNFKPDEFTCACGKCSYSKPEGVVNMDYKLLFIIQSVRNKYGKPMTITCGARCEEYNDSLKGSVKNSYHTKLKACDFYISGVTSTEKGREDVIAYMKSLVGYKYAYHNKGGKYPLMGSAVHIEVK